MAVWKGGRGTKAPYETTHVRIPLPLKSKIEQICEEYKQSILTGEETKQTQSDDSVLEFEQAVELAKTILKQKKSAKISLKSLLTSIYSKEVDL